MSDSRSTTSQPEEEKKEHNTSEDTAALTPAAGDVATHQNVEIKSEEEQKREREQEQERKNKKLAQTTAASVPFNRICNALKKLDENAYYQLLKFKERNRGDDRGDKLTDEGGGYYEVIENKVAEDAKVFNSTVKQFEGILSDGTFKNEDLHEVLDKLAFPPNKREIIIRAYSKKREQKLALAAAQQQAELKLEANDPEAAFKHLLRLAVEKKQEEITSFLRDNATYLHQNYLLQAVRRNINTAENQIEELSKNPAFLERLLLNKGADNYLHHRRVKDQFAKQGQMFAISLFVSGHDDGSQPNWAPYEGIKKIKKRINKIKEADSNSQDQLAFSTKEKYSLIKSSVYKFLIDHSKIALLDLAETEKKAEKEKKRVGEILVISQAILRIKWQEFTGFLNTLIDENDRIPRDVNLAPESLLPRTKWKNFNNIFCLLRAEIPEWIKSDDLLKLLVCSPETCKPIIEQNPAFVERLISGPGGAKAAAAKIFKIYGQLSGVKTAEIQETVSKVGVLKTEIAALQKQQNVQLNLQLQELDAKINAYEEKQMRGQGDLGILKYVETQLKQEGKEIKDDNDEALHRIAQLKNEITVLKSRNTLDSSEFAAVDALLIPFEKKLFQIEVQADFFANIQKLLGLSKTPASDSDVYFRQVIDNLSKKVFALLMKDGADIKNDYKNTTDLEAISKVGKNLFAACEEDIQLLSLGAEAPGDFEYFIKEGLLSLAAKFYYQQVMNDIKQDETHVKDRKDIDRAAIYQELQLQVSSRLPDVIFAEVQCYRLQHAAAEAGLALPYRDKISDKFVQVGDNVQIKTMVEQGIAIYRQKNASSQINQHIKTFLDKEVMPLELFNASFDTIYNAARYAATQNKQVSHLADEIRRHENDVMDKLKQFSTSKMLGEWVTIACRTILSISTKEVLPKDDLPNLFRNLGFFQEEHVAAAVKLISDSLPKARLFKFTSGSELDVLRDKFDLHRHQIIKKFASVDSLLDMKRQVDFILEQIKKYNESKDDGKKEEKPAILQVIYSELELVSEEAIEKRYNEIFKSIKENKSAGCVALANAVETYQERVFKQLETLSFTELRTWPSKLCERIANLTDDTDPDEVKLIYKELGLAKYFPSYLEAINNKPAAPAVTLTPKQKPAPAADNHSGLFHHDKPVLDKIPELPPIKLSREGKDKLIFVDQKKDYITESRDAAGAYNGKLVTRSGDEIKLLEEVYASVREFVRHNEGKPMFLSPNTNRKMAEATYLICKAMNVKLGCLVRCNPTPDQQALADSIVKRPITVDGKPLEKEDRLLPLLPTHRA